ncbi:hypothetical protein [Lachnoclostridium phytofermentans]|nr:hypothetical protein [Lachnoclostridium phytofermentans]
MKKGFIALSILMTGLFCGAILFILTFYREISTYIDSNADN